METDKNYWHRYTDAYETLVFTPLTYTNHVYTRDILEFGVLDGASIEFLDKRFSEVAVNIIGVDIIEQQPSWPVAENISYDRIDQSSRPDLNRFFTYHRTFDLIIDDGSHLPSHQANCLLEGFPNLKKRGYYILEDLHTNYGLRGSPLYALLAIKNIREIGITSPNEIKAKLGGLASIHFTLDELMFLNDNLGFIEFVKRARLPLKCWRCKSNDFDYVTLQCACGVELYALNDSLTCIIQKSTYK